MGSLAGWNEVDVSPGIIPRGVYVPNTIYPGGSLVLHSGTAYIATRDTTASEAPPNVPWGDAGSMGRDGTDGNYTVWLFQRSTTSTAPAAPTSNIGSVDVNGNFQINNALDWKSTVAQTGSMGDLYISWVRINVDAQTFAIGEVVKLSGEVGRTGASITGPAGESVTIQFSPTANSADFHNPPATPNDTHIRFIVGSSPPGTPINFVGPAGADGRDGTDGTDGLSIELQFSQDRSTWHFPPTPDDVYIRFRIGSTGPYAPANGIKFVGEDGQDGDDSLSAEYSADGSSWHSDFRPSTDVFIRFMIGGSMPTPGVRFVGPAGADAPHVIIQFSNVQNASRFTTNYVDGDVFIRFSTDNGVTWTPGDTGTRFVGPGGAGGTDGESISIEFSADGMAGWHAGSPVAADYFIRFQVGARGWQTGIQFRAYPLMIQYSIDGTTLWHDIFVTGTDKFIRFSNDNGVTWTTGDKFISTCYKCIMPKSSAIDRVLDHQRICSELYPCLPTSCSNLESNKIICSNWTTSMPTSHSIGRKFYRN